MNPLFLHPIVLGLLLLLVLLGVQPCQAAEVVLVADMKLRPVMEIVAGLVKTLKVPYRTVSPAEAKGNLAALVEEEHARVVITLGREALNEALSIPPSVLVIYDMVVIPPPISRPNTTGFYMATPAREYVDLVRNHLRDLNQMAVVGSREQVNVLARGDSRTPAYSVRNTVDFLNTLKHLDSVRAILLLPDVSVLTSTAMEQAYLLSFRRKIPLLGYSEKSVKDGALFALVVNPADVGAVIGEYATRAIKGANIGQLPPMPPRKFELFVNLDTARKMGIRLPEELVRTAKRAYP